MACQFNTAEVATMDDLDPYVQDALDLIEFANGPVDTKWGKKRADLGHPAPFNLKMLGVGNENWGPQYIERLKIFQAAIKKQYPEISLVCSSGFIPDGDQFDYLNSELHQMNVEFIDEHYYSSSQWFLDNADRYDTYDRKSISKVFVGEYAARSDTANLNNKNNWRTALAEAAFLTGLERNADVVRMASYAPLFSNVDGWQVKPDLIWVDNLRVMATPNYYVQKLYATNKGNEVVPMLYKLPATPRLAIPGKNDVPGFLPATGEDSLYASASIDTATNELIIKIANVAGKAQTATINIEGVHKIDPRAKLIVLQNDNPEVENSFDSLAIAPVESMIRTQRRAIHIELKTYSFSVMRVKVE
jgi:alpha-L-arabinofuranosidase